MTLTNVSMTTSPCAAASATTCPSPPACCAASPGLPITKAPITSRLTCSCAGRRAIGKADNNTWSAAAQHGARVRRLASRPRFAHRGSTSWPDSRQSIGAAGPTSIQRTKSP